MPLLGIPKAIVSNPMPRFRHFQHVDAGLAEYVSASQPIKSTLRLPEWEGHIFTQYLQHWAPQ